MTQAKSAKSANNQGIENVPIPDWIHEHQARWANKPGLRWYYESQYFAPIRDLMVPGDSLELGAGPGFFADFHRCTHVTDIDKTELMDRAEDVHALSFEDESISNIVGIDVFHHFERPKQALSEMSRVLKPGGRIVFLEPWAGAFGNFFYDKFHHEDCYEIEDLDGRAFREGKDAMDGNAQIPKQFLVDHFDEIAGPMDLRIVKRKYFSFVGWVSTGGFQKPKSPLLLTKMVTAVEKPLDMLLGRQLGLKLLFVAEKAG